MPGDVRGPVQAAPCPAWEVEFVEVETTGTGNQALYSPSPLDESREHPASCGVEVNYTSGWGRQWFFQER